MIFFFQLVAPMLNFELTRVSEEQEGRELDQGEEEFSPEFEKRFADEGGFDNYLDQVWTSRKVEGILLAPKGQLISECPFEILDFPKIPPKNWQISALESKKWSNHKIKALYNVFDTLNNKFDHMYYEKLPLSYDLTTF